MQDIKVVLNIRVTKDDRAVLLYRAFVQDRALMQDIGVGQNRGVVHRRAIHYGGTQPNPQFNKSQFPLFRREKRFHCTPLSSPPKIEVF